MTILRQICWMLLFCIVSVPAHAEDTRDIPELSSILSLFSAHAGDGGIRLNWSLDRQSATIVSFRIYRGYAAAGHFAVLTEVIPHAERGVFDYAFSDTSILPGVTYYYKLSVLGQSSESIFPVVISAASDGRDGVIAGPAGLLHREKISLYVREPGHVTLKILAPDEKALVDDDLNSGVYEFEPPASGIPLRILLKHGDEFSTEYSWPLQ